ncbi:MAG: uracil-DNA glycosylase family protein [Planctomycetota bacterium]
MPRLTKTAAALIDASRALADACDRLAFADPVAHVYNPLRYAAGPHEQYLGRFGRGRKRVLLMGMNPGPWGMAQTGVPFGEVAAVRDFLGLDAPVDPTLGGLRTANRSSDGHPKRPIQGLDCPRSEVSGRRLWGLFADRFGTADAFFNDDGGHLIANYCPLVFMADTARNLTPDKLPAAEREPLERACDDHLATVLDLMRPEFAIGVGKYAQGKLRRVVDDRGFAGVSVGTILHPSPASPAANRGWAEQATRQFVEQGVWPSA